MKGPNKRFEIEIEKDVVPNLLLLEYETEMCFVKYEKFWNPSMYVAGCDRKMTNKISCYCLTSRDSLKEKVLI